MNPVTRRSRQGPRPIACLNELEPYQPPERREAVTIRLDGNEGAAPSPDLLAQATRLSPAVLRDYPSTRELEALLADRLNVDAAQVLVTAGADDALDRACRAVLTPQSEFVLPVPTFEMLERYPLLAGATTRAVPWPRGPYPTDSVLDEINERTAAVAIVSPNNPTGATATADDIRRVSAAASHALLIADLAYVEFADEDLTGPILDLPNSLVIRTLSKAWGLAGLRVGYAVGPPRLVNWLRAVGGPYPASGLSLALAAARLRTGGDEVRKFISRIRGERSRLSQWLAEFGTEPLPSQANFVLARFRDARAVCDGLAAAGIAVRRFVNRPGLGETLRITCPGDETTFDALCTTLRRLYEATPGAFDVGIASGDKS